MRCLLAIPLLLVAPLALACDPIYEPKVAFDPETYVLEGTVVGFVTDSTTYAHGLPPVPGRGEPVWAGGVLIEPTDIVSAPEVAEFYAVFPAGLGSMCEPIYSTEEALAGEYVIGERVYVVAEEGKYRALNAGTVGLYAGCCGNMLTRASLLGSIGVSQDPWPKPLAEPGRPPHDVSHIREQAIQALNASTDQSAGAQIARAIDAFYKRIQFEYERDLAELHGGSLEERLDLLLKIRAYRFQEGGDCEYAAVVDRYWPEEERDRLGAYLVFYRYRPAPTMEMCHEADRLMQDR